MSLVAESTSAASCFPVRVAAELAGSSLSVQEKSGLAKDAHHKRSVFGAGPLFGADVFSMGAAAFQVMGQGDVAHMQWLSVAADLDHAGSSLREESPAALSRANRLLDTLNDYLETRTYLVGERISAADVVVLCAAVPLLRDSIDEARSRSLPHLARWARGCAALPAFSKVLGAVAFFPTSRAHVLGPTTTTPAGRKEKEAKKEEPKPKKEEPKKEEPKPKKEKEAEDDDDDAPKEAKPKSTLDLLPKSTMDFDEFKRTYSNAKDTRAACMPWLAEKFDSAGFSMWYMDYKYNAELTVRFRTSNLVGGYFQRLEKLHKYAFGSVLVLGNDALQAVAGVWIFRGVEGLPDLMLDVDDTEHYAWKRIAWPLSEADAKRVGDMLTGDVDIDGQPVLEWKCFK